SPDAMPLASWHQLNSLTSDPCYDGEARYDPPNDRIVCIGANGALFASLTNLTGRMITEALTSFASVDFFPTSGTTAVLDSASQRLSAYGGDLAGAQPGVVSLETATTAAYTRVDPPVRLYHSAVYATHSDRMIVFGGAANFIETNEVWILHAAS